MDIKPLAGVICLFATIVIVFPVISSHAGTGKVVVANEHGGHEASVVEVKKDSSEGAVSTRRILPSWGYNAHRNKARWRHILKTIQEDEGKHNGKFTLADYGADQGYFSVSTAVAYPNAVVIPVELGGVGGTLWANKKDKWDAIKEIAKRAETYKANNIAICQTKFDASTFARLGKKDLVLDYQFVLSVIHWFEMKNRKEFEVALVNIFRAAKTTIIEFPYIGKDENLAKGQVGYANVQKWLDGRTDLIEVMQSAVDNKEANPTGIKVEIKRIAELPWVKGNMREIHRVDVVSGGSTPKLACAERFTQLQCKKRDDIQQNCAAVKDL